MQLKLKLKTRKKKTRAVKHQCERNIKTTIMPVKTSKLKTRYFKLHHGTLEDKEIEQIVSGRKLKTAKKMT